MRIQPHAQGNLVEEARALLASYGLDDLKGQGFFREAYTYSYVFQYPPSVALHAIQLDSVLENYDPVKTRQMKTGLYVHIPYCTGSCIYCYFTRYPNTSSIIPTSEYLALIKKEIALGKNRKYLDDVSISTIAFGGGTPTFLSADQIRDILDYIGTSLSVTNKAEISFEASPETIQNGNRGVLQAMLQSGVNRISLGIQAFNQHLLDFLGRRHDVSMAIKAISAIRDAGCDNLNIDLMYGLPGQSLQDWESTLCTSTDLLPESISLYRLRIKPGQHTRLLLDVSLPTEESCMLMYVMAVLHLVRHGYIQAASHLFVRDARYIQRHVTEKQGVEECNLIGLGVSAYSYFNSCFYWSDFSLEGYARHIQANLCPVGVGAALSIEEQQRKVMVLGMHEYRGISRSSFGKRFHRYPEELFALEISRLTTLGLLSVSEASICPTDLGYLFADELCTEFYSDAVKTTIAAKAVHRYGINYIGNPEETPSDENRR